MTDQEYVVRSFAQQFHAYKDKRIILYGVGIQTKAIVERYPEYRILGLMDKTRVGEIFYGKRVLSLSEVAASHPDLIVVVARSVSRRLIYERIRNFVCEKKIPLYGIDGKDLRLLFEPTVSVPKDEQGYLQVTTACVREQIEGCDVLCCRIRDTLFAQPFVTEAAFERVARERKVPASVLMFQTWQIRRTVLVLLDYARQSGKKVFLLADEGLPAAKWDLFLEKAGIQVDEGLLMPSQFCPAVEAYVKQGEKVLLLSSRKEDLAFGREGSICVQFLKSAWDLLKISSYQDLPLYLHTTNDWSLAGMFAMMAFNDPFALAGTDGRLCVSQAFDLGRLFYMGFSVYMVLNFIQRLQQGAYDGVLFAARDGYLVQKLYRYAVQRLKIFGLPPDQYFETSRALCWRASVCTEQDILQVLNECQVSLYEIYLQRLFGLAPGRIETYDAEQYRDMAGYTLAHKEKIFAAAASARKNYMKYIARCDLKPDGRYAFFDFTSRGTCQQWLSRLLPCQLEGVYFCHYEHAGMKPLQVPIQAVIEAPAYVTDMYFFAHYIDAEMIFSAPVPSLQSIDENGKPAYFDEVRSKEEVRYMQEAQKGIFDAFAYYIDNLYLPGVELNWGFVDQLYRFVGLKFTNETCRDKDFLMRDDACGVDRSLLSQMEHSTRGRR